ncbi:lipocalin family protein [Mucilaginibacter lacusdianchii]|uniref:lipocalin family protein n=1 Tax=Mucilaginibacter lacusdianchii TaxID=2684211 RepID=UPI00131A91D2|nr:lipocalin family protein [Mucilaginibacter sp. JXJ CY 39]
MLLITVAVIHSCKKNDPSESLNVFLQKPWQLASLRVDNYRGDTVTRDTLNTNCNLRQVLEFRGDGTCHYSNYSCLEDKVYGQWTLSEDRLKLSSDIRCKDTSKVGSIQPFLQTDTSYTSIINLGENSLVLEVNQTLDTIRKTPLVLKRKVTRYAFIGYDR